MTTEEFYRGGSRSPFRADYIDGRVTVGANKNLIPLVVVPSASFQRVKRLQVTICIPKGTTEHRGWSAFYRLPDNLQVPSSTAVTIDDPWILRPKVWVSNTDHAIYQEIYLEAINLAGGAVCGLIMYSSANQTITYAAKWYSEEQAH